MELQSLSVNIVSHFQVPAILNDTWLRHYILELTNFKTQASEAFRIK